MLSSRETEPRQDLSARDVDRPVAQEGEALLGEWLQALDSVERAPRQPVAAGNPLFAGLHAVLEQMETILERQGAQRVGSAVVVARDPEGAR